MSAESKRCALALYFCVRICYMFLLSNCRGQSHLGLCTTSVLANRYQGALANSDKFCGQTRVWIGIHHPAAAFFLQVLKLCTDLDPTLLFIMISGTHSNFRWKNNFLAPGVCFPQTCSSAGRRFAASRSRLHYSRRIVVSTTTKSMKCLVNWNVLRICVRWRNTQPHLKLGFHKQSKIKQKEEVVDAIPNPMGFEQIDSYL